MIDCMVVNNILALFQLIYHGSQYTYPRFPGVLLTVHCLVFFPCNWLHSYISIVKTMDSSERILAELGIKPVTCFQVLCTTDKVLDSATSMNFFFFCICSILMKPVMRSSDAWQTAAKDIKELADCLCAYKDYLIKQNMTAKTNQSLTRPARTISEDATIEHRKPCNTMGLREEYKILDSCVRAYGIGIPLVFDENSNINTPFISNNQRYQFIKNLHLSVPIDIIRFSPGGSIVTTLCISQVPSERSEADILVQGARLLQRVRPNLIENHTRAQRKIFKAKLSSLANISPAVCDFIYKELTMDGVTATHPITQERLRLISLGHTGLIADLRHLNPGRPNNRFDTFFEACLGSSILTWSFTFDVLLAKVGQIQLNM